MSLFFPSRTLLLPPLLAGFAGLPAAEPAAAEPPLRADQLVVTATRLAVSPAEAPTVLHVIDAATLETSHAQRLGDALAATPGLYVRGSAFGDTTPGSGLGGISLRGISNSRTLLLVDGQTLNGAYSGAINWSAVPLDDAARIEIAPGPFSSLYGGAAMGGVIHVLTRPPERREFTARAGTGSGAGTERSASFVLRDTPTRGFAFSLGAGWRDHDSYLGDYVIKSPTAGTAAGTIAVTGAERTLSPAGLTSYNIGDKGRRPWEQRHAFAKLHFDLGAAGRLTTGYAYDRFDTHYTPFTSYLRDAAGQPVTRGTVSFADPAPRRFSVNETDFLVLQPSAEDTRRVHALYELDLAPRTQLRFSAGHARFGTYFVSPRTGVATYDAGPGTLSDSPSTRADFEGQLAAPFGRRHQLVAGLAFQKTDLHRENWDLAAWRNPRAKLTRYYDTTGTARTWAAYAQDRIRLTDTLSLYAGARFTRWETRGRATQTPTPAQPALAPGASVYPARREAELSPKASLVWRALPALTLRASAGTAFQTPTLFDLYAPSYVAKTGPVGIRITEADPNLKPEILRSAEVGAEFALRSGARATLTGYVNDLRDLIYQQTIVTGTANDLNRKVNAGSSRVRGLEATVAAPLGAGFSAHASAGYTDTEILRNDISPATVGRRLGDVPLLTTAGGLAWARGRFDAQVSARYASHVYTRSDELNANVINGVFGAYDAHAVVNARAGFAFTRHLRASLAIENLLDRDFYAFYRQPGRRWFLELVTRF